MVETSGSDSRTTVMIKNIPNKYRLVFFSATIIIIPLLELINKLILLRSLF